MIEMLANDNQEITKTIKPVLQIAQSNDDEVTADLLIQRLTVHEKATWMLKSLAK
jgi:starvation-inducible DNA-binding protein